MAESPSSDPPLFSQILDPRCGVAGTRIKLDGDSALEIWRIEVTLLEEIRPFAVASTRWMDLKKRSG